MKYDFITYQMEVEEHRFWVAESKTLKGCVGQGDDVSSAIQELEENEIAWLDAAKEFGIPIPPETVRTPESYSGKISLRISPFTHEESSILAKEQGISLNQYFNDAIVAYNERVKHHPYPVKRAQMPNNVLTFPGEYSPRFQEDSYPVEAEDLEEM